MIEGYTGNYAIELLIVPPVNINQSQTSHYGNTQLKFILPVECNKITNGADILHSVTSLVYHEIAHLELVLNWPGGWETRGKKRTEKKFQMLVQEILAGQAEHCSILTAGDTGGAMLEIKGAESGADGYIRHFLKQINDGKTELSTSGSEIAKMRLWKIVGDYYDPTDKAEKDKLQRFCANTLTTENIVQLLAEMQVYRPLISWF
ncbi:hypothetical protein A5320_04855 [Rheinheimera sp. SA_1]|nr:hypothetical protein A5320_04855 [Rheinheimera sp. SA_1]